MNLGKVMYWTLMDLQDAGKMPFSAAFKGQAIVALLGALKKILMLTHTHAQRIVACWKHAHVEDHL